LKEIACLTISLISTIVAFFILVFGEGEEHIAGGFDCTVKTCCLLAIATTVRADNVKLLGTFPGGLLCFGCFKKPQAMSPRASHNFALSILSALSWTTLTEEIEKLTAEIEKLSSGLSVNTVGGSPPMYTEYSRPEARNAQHVIELANLQNLSDLNGSLTPEYGGTERKSQSTITRVLYVQQEDGESCGSSEGCMVRHRAASPEILPLIVS